MKIENVKIRYGCIDPPLGLRQFHNSSVRYGVKVLS